VIGWLLSHGFSGRAEITIMIGPGQTKIHHGTNLPLWNK
jgi:hypothetical protein